MISSWLTAGAAILLVMVLIWAASLYLKNSSIVDIFWGLLFVLVAWVVFYISPEGFLPRKILVAGLVSVWGLRLAWYIFRRNHGKPEDFRYAAWRTQYGSAWWWRSFFQSVHTSRSSGLDYLLAINSIHLFQSTDSNYFPGCGWIFHLVDRVYF